MANHDDKVWRDIASHLRRDLRLRPLSMEEADKEYDAADAVPLSEGRLEEMVDAAMSGEHAIWDASPDAASWTSEFDATELESDVRQLNRNLNNEEEKDADVDDLLDQHRREALADDDEEDTNNSAGAEGVSD